MELFISFMSLLIAGASYGGMHNSAHLAGYAFKDKEIFLGSMYLILYAMFLVIIGMIIGANFEFYLG